MPRSPRAPVAMADRREHHRRDRPRRRGQPEEDVRHRPVRHRCGDHSASARQGDLRRLLRGDRRLGELPSRRRALSGERARQHVGRLPRTNASSTSARSRCCSRSSPPASISPVEGLRRHRTRPRRHLQRLRHRVPADDAGPTGLQPGGRRPRARPWDVDRPEERCVRRCPSSRRWSQFTDWALNEECNQFDECGGYQVYIASEQGRVPGGVHQPRALRRPTSVRPTTPPTSTVC